MSIPQYLGSYPRNRQTGWSGDLQGVTNDTHGWYFTQEQTLWYFPVNHDLATQVTSELSETGIRHTHMPDALSAMGYNHFGDPAYYGGFLFIPTDAQGSSHPPRIVAMRASDFQYIDSVAVDGQSESGWCAVEPRTGSLYTSDKEVSLVQPIRVFEIDFDRLRRPESPMLEITLSRQIRPFSRVSWLGLRVPVSFRHLQGGVIGEDGRLYISNGYYSGYPSRRGGIRVFDPITGEQLAKSSTTRLPFKYEYHPGLAAEEPEGLTWWDLDDGRAPGVSGQLHAIMLDNDPFNEDDLYFKHYRIARIHEVVPATR